MFDSAIAPLVYEGRVRELHLAFKFSRNLAAGRLLATLFSNTVSERPETMPELLVPIPLHAARMRSRGFDQSLELAKDIGRQLGIAVDTSLLHRQRATQPQSGLSRKRRIHNLNKAFYSNQVGNYTHIALVDDVMTTGSTFNAAAAPLRKRGILKIEAWAPCRALVSK